MERNLVSALLCFAPGQPPCFKLGTDDDDDDDYGGDAEDDEDDDDDGDI